MRKRQQIQKQATNITNTRTMRQKSKDLEKSKYLERHKSIPPLCQGCEIWREISRNRKKSTKAHTRTD